MKKKIILTIGIVIALVTGSLGCLEAHAEMRQKWEVAVVSVKIGRTDGNSSLAEWLEQSTALAMTDWMGTAGMPEGTALEQTECFPDYPAMIMVEDALYYDSGEISTELRCGMMDGSITSVTEGVPTQNNQSNFGTGYHFQYGVGTIEVYIEEKWHIFIPYETPSYVSDWDSLSEEERMEQNPTYLGQ